MDRQSQILTLAFSFSFLLHGAVLATTFSFPHINLFDTRPALDIVLVNSKSHTRPFLADALAQNNLDGGGNTDKKRRAKTPLPALNRSVQGDALVQATARQKELEAETQRLMAQIKSKEAETPVAKKSPNEIQPQQQSANDLTTHSLAIERLEAEIARQMDEYQQRPKKAFVGARAQEYRFAQYAEDWRIKIERIGNLNYPEGARGRTYGALRLTVEVRADGSVENMTIEHSSGVKLLDQAALRIVRMAAPFPAFPPNLREFDRLVITRTWTFAPGGGISTE